MTNKAKNFELHYALDFILDGADSEISDFSSDEDDVIETGLHQDMECENGDIDVDECQGDLIDSINTTESVAQKTKRTVFRWRKKDIPQGQLHFSGENEKFDGIESTLHYFKLFWTDNLTNLIVENTNLYSAEKTGKSISSKDVWCHQTANAPSDVMGRCLVLVLGNGGQDGG